MRVILLACLVVAVTTVLANPDYEFEAPGYTFEEYCKDFGKSYEPAEYRARSAIFSSNLKKIIAHNKHSAKFTRYRMAVNKFTDMSQQERKKFLGYSLGKKLSTALEAQPAEMPYVDVDALPTAMDWRNKQPSVISPVKDQGGCGSCWAHATTELVEFAVATATGTLTPLSRQNVVDCAPNPNDCGGTGGCEGATAEIGFAYVKDKGMASENDYPYTGSDGQCNESAKKAAIIEGWVVLPPNNYTAVLIGVATLAPLAITVSANSWFGYSSGVFTGCGTDYDLDHAVQLVGYGTDSGMDYWTVRNSWGEGWGESGYIRIQKHSDGSPQWCGIDTSPSDGTGCQGGPSQVTVCGSCGLWYDTCYATGGSIPASD